VEIDAANAKPSLESLIESEDLGIEGLHPGGLAITRELAGLCGITAGTRVLDVASGTGESACFLGSSLGAEVVGVDLSAHLVQRARDKAAKRGLSVEFRQGDALALEFDADTFDAVISECSLCLLDKEQAIAEMVRVAKPGGHVGMHDVCWSDDTPDRLKRRLARLEGEVPETGSGWRSLFERAGLIDVAMTDKPQLVSRWTESIKRSLGLRGRFRVFLKAARRWGLSGVLGILGSERVLSDRHIGYVIVVGRKSKAVEATGGESQGP